MTSKLPVPTVGTIWASVLHKYSDNYAKYALEYFECFLLKHPTSNQNLSESLCLLGFERGGVFVNTPPTPHQLPTNSHSIDLGYFYRANHR